MSYKILTFEPVHDIFIYNVYIYCGNSILSKKLFDISIYLKSFGKFNNSTISQSLAHKYFKPLGKLFKLFIGLFSHINTSKPTGKSSNLSISF